MRTLRGNDSKMSNKMGEKTKPHDDDDDVGADGDETTDDEGGIDTPPPPVSNEEEQSTAKEDKKMRPKEERLKNGKAPKKRSKAEEEYEVDQIVDMETKSRWKCPVKFRVRWVGYGEKDDSWLPMNLLTCDDLVTDFLEISGRKSEYDKALEAKKRPAEDNAWRQSSRKMSRISYSELEADEEEILPSGTKTRKFRTRFIDTTPQSKVSPKKTKPKGSQIVAKVQKRQVDYEVESIRDMRGNAGQVEFKVRWKGWASKYDSWLKEKELNCPLLIKNYKNAVKKIEEQDDWQVETIIDVREKKGKKEFLIHWKGFDSKFDSWEPQSNLSGCRDILQAFLNKGKKTKVESKNMKVEPPSQKGKARRGKVGKTPTRESRTNPRRGSSNVSYSENYDDE